MKEQYWQIILFNILKNQNWTFPPKDSNFFHWVRREVEWIRHMPCTVNPVQAPAWPGCSPAAPTTTPGTAGVAQIIPNMARVLTVTPWPRWLRINRKGPGHPQHQSRAPPTQKSEDLGVGDLAFHTCLEFTKPRVQSPFQVSPFPNRAIQV